MIRAMAIDHASDSINVKCVCPGDVDTPMLKSECEQFGGVYEDKYRDRCAEHPLAIPGMPLDVVMCVFSCVATWRHGSRVQVLSSMVAT
jgi:NAD(P)-dependent dehydrogenase (short-subunit alcohol dehydrogenase family)